VSALGGSWRDFRRAEVSVRMMPAPRRARRRSTSLRVPPRRLLLAALLLALTLPAGARALEPGPPRHLDHPLIGIGEQHPAMFSDPRFKALAIRYARLSIGWNALESRPQSRALATWLRAAHADGVQPLIVFEHSWIAHRHRELPSAAALARQFRLLRARYPWVRDFATWNEANYCGQPTCHAPGLVAAYYTLMRHICPSCDVLAAELLDVPGMVAWAREERASLGYEPGSWGLHDYIGANHLSTASTRALLSATRGQIWLTETGGVVARHNHSAHDFPESASHAATVTRFVFDRIVPLSPRVARVYLYQWNAGPNHREPWDSGLIGPHGTPRPAFWVLVRELHALGQLPATSAAVALLGQAGRVAAARGEH
jgi:hypothetical protein